MSDTRDPFTEGTDALGEGDWERARTCFERAVAADDIPEAHAGLATALWWSGDLAGALGARQRAYTLFRAAGDVEGAIGQAIWLVVDNASHVGNHAAASGWLARVERLVEQAGTTELAGWLDFVRSCDHGDAAEGERLARRALEFAQATDDADLELCALSNLGYHVVRQGRLGEGIGYLDESMAGSLAAADDHPDTVVLAGCNMMVSCVTAADLDRAVRWVEASDRFAERFGCPFLYVECRTIYGRILFGTGDWAAAEDELRTAIASAEDSVPEFHAQALATLSELRLAQGRHTEARSLLSGIEDHEWAVPVVGRIHLTNGRVSAAAAVVSRRLDRVGPNLLERSVLLELLGEIDVADGGVDDAEVRAGDLLDLAERADCAVVAARGRRLLGRIALARGDASGAVGDFEAALAGFGDLRLVYEEARARFLLAEALSVESDEAARDEAERALRVFEDLGAARDVDRAASLLRQLGGGAGRRTGRQRRGRLTAREQEVLGLLGEGLTNPEIADRLYISRKTVEHHVASVLTKLGVRNRAEAAAAAVRGIGGSATE